jgi:acetolactate synthase-1/2/3 large subunit
VDRAGAGRQALALVAPEALRALAAELPDAFTLTVDAGNHTGWPHRYLAYKRPARFVGPTSGAMGYSVPAAVAASLVHPGRLVIGCVGDGGFMLNVGELACAVQEQAHMVVLLMNDSRYGVIKNIQDDIYGGRHAYVELHTPDFAQFCASLKATHLRLDDPAQASAVLAQALASSGPVIVEVDMAAWGPFAVKFAGPILKKD